MSEPRIRVKIDGKFVFKGNLGDWIAKPPSTFTDAIKPGAQPEPHLKAVMVALSDAVLARQSMDITVETNPKGWTLEVKRP